MWFLDSVYVPFDDHGVEITREAEGPIGSKPKHKGRHFEFEKVFELWKEVV